ncbi:helix-turn-helix domain-containing protein [Clostridium sp.]|uniref:helix-turn-helix domain-containing protein n=1 Tax=Clostridium sp. TaxID=1506 RepID=UPI002625A201|nr:helix-turn-helix transcriptional regulator [uncultured Clostridium sp.]
MISEMFNKLTWYKRIEVLRIGKDWNQNQASIECITHNKNYWLWENGLSYPRFKSRKAIANAFGVEMDYIFHPTDKVVKKIKII